MTQKFTSRDIEHIFGRLRLARNANLGFHKFTKYFDVLDVALNIISGKKTMTARLKFCYQSNNCLKTVWNIQLPKKDKRTALMNLSLRIIHDKICNIEFPEITNADSIKENIEFLRKLRELVHEGFNVDTSSDINSAISCSAEILERWMELVDWNNCRKV